MKEDDRDRLIAELLAKPLERERVLDAAELSKAERQALEAVCETADLLWLAAQGAPTPSEDPIAAMLGLVPDDDCRLDSAALSRARKRAGVKVSDVAERLQARGWAFETGDVFRWETRSAVDVAPAVVQAIADILGEPVESLIRTENLDSHNQELADVRRHPLFEPLVDRWARLQRVSRVVALASLETRMLATVHRGERPDPEQLLHTLEALVDSLEERDEQ